MEDFTLKDIMECAFTILEEENAIKYTKKYNREYLIEGFSQTEIEHWKWFGFQTSSSLGRQLGRVIKKSNDSFWFSYLVNLTGYNICNTCGHIKEITEFKKQKSEKRGFISLCLDCSKLKWKKFYNNHDRNEYLKTYMANRRANKLNATPKWENINSIKEFYKNCPLGYHVDHIIPLKGKLVCGLHTIDNLQYLKAEDNRKKGNKFKIK